MEEAWHPFEFTIDFIGSNDVGDLVDAGGAGLPKSFGSVPAKGFDQAVQSFVGDVRKMGGGMAGVGSSAAATLQQSDLCAFTLQQISRGDTGQAASDDRNIHLHVMRKRLEMWNG